MNVIQREIFNKRENRKRQYDGFFSKFKKTEYGNNKQKVSNIYSLPAKQYSKTPRYTFENSSSSNKKAIMGPPSETPRTVRKRLSSSTKPGSSSDPGKWRSQMEQTCIAGDSSKESNTPHVQGPIRYISSSSRGSTRKGLLNSAKSTTTTTSAVEPCVVLAISEGRGLARGEVGLAAINLRQPHLVLCQFSDSLSYVHTLTKINYFNPVEIIVPHTFREGVKPTTLYQLIRDQFSTVTLTTVPRRHFNDAFGLQQIKHLCAPEYSTVYLLTLHKFYALTAAAAVLKYVENIQCIVFAAESLKIEFHCSENTMFIDVDTATRLELVQPLYGSNGINCSLLGILGPTQTVGGLRALRADILQPSTNRQHIEMRLDCVQELIENTEGLMGELQCVLKHLTEVDRILFLCMEIPNQDANRTGEAQLNQTLLLKQTMDLLPSLIHALSLADGGRFRKIKMDLENPCYAEITEKIMKIIQEDAHLEKGAVGYLQRCFAVRPDINGLLDVARRTYSELIDDLQTNVQQLGDQYDLPIRLHHNTTKGFHIVMSIAPKNRSSFRVEDLPSVFIQAHRSGNSVYMTTEEIILLDQQAKESLNEIQAMSNIVIYGLLKELRPLMGNLYKLCEHVSELDVLLTLAQASSILSYIRPEFNKYMEIRNSIHPLLDFNSLVMPVPNDIFASPEYNFSIITGPNMGGKSIYIKQIPMIHILAQIGCFVPATKAVLRITDYIFSRIGFNDSIECNASTYILEMKEIQHILQSVTPNSLVIVDELCRATSSEEGASIAWAICEELLNTKAFTFFTTHFIFLTKLQDLYANVINLYTEADEELKDDIKKLIYRHKIRKGVTNIENYGLTLARSTNLPIATVQLAEELASVIARGRKPLATACTDQTNNTLLYNLYAEVKQMYRNYESQDNIFNKMKKFTKKHANFIEHTPTKSRKHSSIEPTTADNENKMTDSSKSNPIHSNQPQCNTSLNYNESYERNSNIDSTHLNPFHNEIADLSIQDFEDDSCESDSYITIDCTDDSNVILSEMLENDNDNLISHSAMKSTLTPFSNKSYGTLHEIADNNFKLAVKKSDEKYGTSIKALLKQTEKIRKPKDCETSCLTNKTWHDDNKSDNLTLPITESNKQYYSDYISDDNFKSSKILNHICNRVTCYGDDISTASTQILNSSDSTENDSIDSSRCLIMETYNEIVQEFNRSDDDISNFPIIPAPMEFRD